MMKPLNIGIAGFGTVGGGLAEVLRDNADWTKRRAGREVRLKMVCDLDESKKGLIESFGAAYTKSLDDILNDPQIDVAVELIGGTGVAKDFIIKAIKAGKHVVTANKALLAEYGDEIFPLATKAGVYLGFEASVAGGIPLVETIKGALAGNRVEGMLGILNGTANYILTEMTDKGMAFEPALADAQAKGYAEADPTLDVEGGDPAHKLTLLIQLAFGVHYPFEKLPVTGISVVKPIDIGFAREFGYEIKLLAHAKYIDGKIEAGVFPALIPSDYMLAKVKGSFNAVRLEGNAGPVMLMGYGAGDRPTGSAVLADIMSVAKGVPANVFGFEDDVLPEADILNLDDAVSPHYLRFIVPDKTGLLRDIGGVMADHGISIAQAVQKGQSEAPGEGVPLILLTHEAKADDIHRAMDDADSRGLCLERAMHYRIF
jgi:homoserine dehydrogenase